MLCVRYALMKKSVPPSEKQQVEDKVAIFTVLMTTWAFNHKSLILLV